MVNFVEGSKEVQFNCIRLIRYALSNDSFFINHYQEIWQVYQLTVFHSSGNVRNAGVWLLAEYWFTMTIFIDDVVSSYNKIERVNKKKKEEMELFFVMNGMSLFELERDYVEQHKKKLSKKEIGDGRYIPFPSETKDPYLRTIRRGIDEIARGNFFDRLAQKHGYGKISDEKEDEKRNEIDIEKALSIILSEDKNKKK
jgi:hypothetical protein